MCTLVQKSSKKQDTPSRRCTSRTLQEISLVRHTFLFAASTAFVQAGAAMIEYSKRGLLLSFSCCATRTIIPLVWSSLGMPIKAYQGLRPIKA